MIVTVEFFGIPRERTKLSKVIVEGARLDEVFRELEEQFPDLAQACLQDGRLREGFAANLNGERFVSDPATEMQLGDSLLIMTADAGG
ncbi:MAG: MoaD/ThiS family protein [Planctomycetales bacterium]